MPKVTPTSARKADHIRINLEEDVRSGLTTGLENFSFLHQAVPEINLKDINLGISILGKSLQAPILISSMTGGTAEAMQINLTLAAAAQHTGIAMGLGSQRAAIENPELAKTYHIRKTAPDILLFANLGAVQLNYGYTIAECRRAVEMVEADGLIFHLNPLQEAVQPEGDTNFSGLLKKIEAVCRDLPVPVIVKEVGWGISGNVAQQLWDAGIAAIDVAGAGGTSWTQVEMHRAKNPFQARLAKTFINWGIPTADSIIQVKNACPEMPIIASGGIYDGLDIAKSIGLGASLGAMARPFLKAAQVSVEQTIQTIQQISLELQVTMFAAGAAHLEELKEKIVPS
jgi:isopentenyl-diphosphate delta-isomerase